MAIENAGIVEVHETERLEVTFPHNLFHTAKKAVENAGGRAVEEEYGQLVKFAVKTMKDEAEALMALLRERTRGRVRLRALFMRGL